MIKKLCLLLLLPVAGYTQSLDLSVPSGAAGNDYTTFSLDGQNVSLGNNALGFPASGFDFGGYLAYGIAPDYRSLAVVQNRAEGPRAYLLSNRADTLGSYSTISVGYDDPSLALFLTEAGEMLIRNNIANFTLYDPFGGIRSSASGSSQSEQGEAIAEVAMDPTGSTVLLYTPKIKLEGGFGSQAQLLAGNSTKTLFYSSDRFLKNASVSDDGQFVSLITASEGTDDRVIVMDRHGNTLNEIRSEEELVSARFTGDNTQLLLYSSRRALVYSVMGGERVGSTSFRSPLMLAAYFPEDHTVVAVTGEKVENTEIYRNLEFHAINLEQREIARRELDGALGTGSSVPLRILREGGGTYRLAGTSKPVVIEASF